MKQVDVFLECLQRWADTVSEDDGLDLQTAVFLLGFVIGDQGDIRERPEIGQLRSRLDYLIREEEMDEDFLVMSLTRFMSEWLQKRVENHGLDILMHQEMLERDPSGDLSKRHLARLKAPGYQHRVRQALTTWRVLVLEKLGPYDRAVWEAKRMRSAGI